MKIDVKWQKVIKSGYKSQKVSESDVKWVKAGEIDVKWCKNVTVLKTSNKIILAGKSVYLIFQHIMYITFLCF